MKQLPLPYLRDPRDLPAPLPTTEEIRGASNIIKGDDVCDTRRVVTVGCHYLVKYGPRARRIEGDNLLFLELQKPQIRAPRLYAMWQDANNELYIVMERILGQPLDTLWPSLSIDDRKLILGKLRGIFDQIRAIPSPGFFGSVTGGKVPHALCWMADDDPEVNGPFGNGQDLVRGLAKKSRKKWLRNGYQTCMPDFFERRLAPAVGNHSPVFSHTDLLRKNVIVRETSLPPSVDSGRKRDKEVVVVDWEDAGWYPAYWEYAVAFAGFVWYEDDWPNAVESILDPWCAEAAMLKMIIDDIW